MDLANGWDTVLAIRVKDLNANIATITPTLGAFQQTSSGGSGTFALQGVLGKFQIVERVEGLTTGESGLAVSVAIQSGSFTAKPLNKPQIVVELAGKSLEIQLELEKTQLSGKTVLSPSPEKTQVVNITGIADLTVLAMLKAMFNSWLSAHPKTFATTFATIAVSDGSGTGALDWLKPTTVEYAAVIPPTGFPDAIFAILAMTENRNSATLTGVVVPGVLPPGVNAALTINQRLFLEKLIRPAATALMARGTKAEDFTVGNENTLLSSNKALTTQPIDLNGPLVADIPPGKFNISIDGGNLILDMTDFHVTWQSGVELFLHYRETLQLILDGQKLKLKRIDSSTDPHAEFSQAAEIGLIVTGIAVAILAVVGAAFAGVLAEGTAAVVSETASEAGTAVVMETVTTTVDEGADTTAVEAVEQESTEAAASEVEAVEEGSTQAAEGPGWFARNSLKLRAGLIAGVTGVVIDSVIQAVPQILKASIQADATDLPALDAFALNILQPVQWPLDSQFKLTNVALNDSLQFSGNLTFTPLAGSPAA